MLEVAEERATSLLDRFEDCGLCYTDELTEDELSGSSASETFQEVCCTLAKLLANVAAASGAPNLQAIHGAAAAVEGAQCGGDADEKPELDAALWGLEHALHPGSAAKARLPVLERLVGHLQAARMLLAMRGPAAGPCGDGDAEPHAAMDAQDAKASSTWPAVATQLRELRQRLGLQDQGAAALVTAAERQVTEVLAATPPGFAAPILEPNALNNAQRAALAEVDGALRGEYTLRRRMLVERAKVTLQSFLYSERLQNNGTLQAAKDAAEAGRAAMAAEPSVRIEAVFALTRGALFELTRSVSSAGIGGGTSASVKGVLMGKVPDRGGRPTEGRSAAISSMPTWGGRAPTAGGGAKRSGGAKGHQHHKHGVKK